MLNKYKLTTINNVFFPEVLTLENSRIAAFRHFSNMTPPLPRPHGIVKCPSNAYYRIRTEVVGHPGTSRLLFFEYYEFGHTTRLAYCFSHTI